VVSSFGGGGSQAYLGAVLPPGDLVDVSVDGAGEVDGEGVALAVTRRDRRHLKSEIKMNI